MSSSISVAWDATSAQSKADCKARAEERAGPSEHGYLYRLYWGRKKQSIRLIAYPILKITPRCWKIQPKIHTKPTYVSMDKPYYAQPELSEALESYRIRRTYMVSRCEQRLKEARLSLSCADPLDPIHELYWLQDEFAPVKDDVVEDEEELV